MPPLFKEFAARLKPRLDAAVDLHLNRLLADAGSPATPVESALLSGGKRLRGTLLCLVATALDGTLEGALPRAVAVELIHTASLIHDDFVDQHPVRRAMAALWTLKGARRAVLLGDLLFSSAICMLSELAREDGLLIARTIAEVSRGACREPLDAGAVLREMEGGGLNAGLYDSIITLKTGMLFGTACELGALAAGAGDDARACWRHYGEKIGEAYQISDDLHDMEGFLRSGAVTAPEMAALAPALLRFADGSRPCVMEGLAGEALPLRGEPLQLFCAAMEGMRAEKERRLRAALDGIGGQCGDDAAGRLLAAAPREIMEMFDEVDGRPRG